MKVLFVAPTYFSESSIIGGGERYVEKFAEAMSKKCELHVFSFGLRANEFTRKSVHYRIFRFGRFGHFSQTNPFALGHYFAVLRGRFDVVHTHQMCTFVTDLACIAAHHANIPAVTTDHGGGGAWVLNNRIDVFSKYQRAIGQSDAASRLLDPRFGERVVTLKGGISMEEFCPDLENDKNDWVLFVGRLLPHKGLHTLIRAFRIAKLDGFQLIILGRPMKDEYFQELQTLAQGLSVRFITSASDDELKHYYRRAKITVLPSENIEGDTTPPELMGFTSLESQASGTPVVVSDAGPMAEFIDPGVTGFVFRNGNVEALASTLREAVKLYQEPTQIVASRCRTSVEQFSWEALADQHLDLYQQLIDTRSAGLLMR